MTSRTLLCGLISTALMLTFNLAASAASLYGDNYGSTAHIDVLDPATGIVTDQFDARAGNGRGVVVVGNTVYYTIANSGSVFSYDLATHTDNGALFSVTGASGLSTAAFDGTNLILGDYSGTNKAYVYSLGGSLVRTIALSNCSSFCDGLEYFLDPVTGAPRLISNRGDTVGPYDVYDYATGSLLTASFITPHSGTVTGIAFDGTDFFVSDIFGSNIEIFNSSGTFVKNLPVVGNTGSGFEDLSVDYSIVLPSTGVPEPGTVALGGLALAGLALVLRLRKSNPQLSV
jgi:LPXTG-motif cell wall-anchored protein